MDMDVASVPLKLEAAHGDGRGGAATEVVAAGAVAGMRIASARIGVTTDWIALDAPIEEGLACAGKVSGDHCNCKDLEKPRETKNENVDRRKGSARQRLPGRTRQNQALQFRRAIQLRFNYDDASAAADT